MVQKKERARFARISLRLSLVTPQDALFKIFFLEQIFQRSNYDFLHFNVQLEIQRKTSSKNNLQD